MTSGKIHTGPPSRRASQRPSWRNWQYWRHLFGAVVFTVLFAGMGQTAIAAGEVLRVRTGAHPDMTRLVVDVTERAEWQIDFASDGRSLVIRIEDVRMATFVPETNLKGIIRGVEARALADIRGVEISVTLDQPAHLQRRFVLDADISRSARLVLDLLPGHVPEVADVVEAIEVVDMAKAGAVEEAAPETSVPPIEPLTAAKAPPTPSAPSKNSSTSSGFGAPPPPPPPLPPASRSRGYESDFSGSIEVEARYFNEPSGHTGPRRQTASIAIEPKLDVYWKDGDSILTIAPFARLDAADSHRTHVDIREFKWVGVFDPFELRIGVDKVFWGVTESAHLVDIINQDDQLEDIDSEDKLGQPMVALTVDTGFGFLSAYALPYFRERAFPGYRGRPAGPLMVDADQAIFQSGDNNWTTDWAARWSHSVGALDLGLSYFSGLSRDPRFALGLDVNGGPVLLPIYDQIDQVGAEIQGTFGAVLVKFEAIRQWNYIEDYTALAGGLEYTFYGLGGGASDFGVLAEYLYDSRGRFGPSPIEKDLFVGFRWSANDVASTTILAGAIFDLNESTTLINVEASRRLNDNWKITLDARLFPQVDPWDPLIFFEDDDFIQLRLARYF